MVCVVTTTGPRVNHYWSKCHLVLVRTGRAIRGVSLSCDAAGLPLALVNIFHSRKVDDSKYGKFISLLGSIRSPMLGKSACFLWGGATSAPFPYHVIGRVSDQYIFIPPIRIALFYGGRIGVGIEHRKRGKKSRGRRCVSPAPRALLG